MKNISPLFWGLLAVCVLFAGSARAADEKRADLSKAVVNVSALQPGKPAMAAVVLDIKPGFHAQSHAPLDPLLVKFKIKLDPNDQIDFGEPQFPEGEMFNDGKEKLSVYHERVIVRVPLTVKPSAAPGKSKITGKLMFQICDEKTNVCFIPDESKFEISAAIVSAAEAVTANEPDLFKGATTNPATSPSRSAAGAGDVSTMPPIGPGSGSGAAAQYTVLGAFLLAFVVGIIFNVMPCVLPVVPLKAMGFYEVSQHNRARSISFGLVFSLGVVSSFALLGLLVVVKQVFHWGELFANPFFLGSLVVILLVMSLSMFGVFGVGLPGWIYQISPRHDTYSGNFLFGILTAALSTPCTFGMFVGLLTWALSQPSAVGMGLMITVGAGMAFPYLILSAFPEAARRFPRTGPWAELIKQFMGFLLLGSAIYFAEPFIEKIVKPQAFWWLIFTVAVAACVFLMARTIQYSRTLLPRAIVGVIVLLILLPTYFIVHRLTLRPYDWQPYTPQALAAARAANKVVVVEFTATWCTNCHTLEAFVLNAPSVVKTVSKYDVLMMRADLSSSDAPGWQFLRELKGEGVPLTAVYSPSQKDPIRLTGIYKVEELQSAITNASHATVALK